jgi:glycosyltransferase involved in cell wall biosynthesis
MKLLWANSSFLHPTTRGGQIRTLEMLRQLHQRHEIHYVALADPAEPEGPARAGEYSTRSFAFDMRRVSKRSPQFAWDVALGTFSSLPLAISRWRSPEMSRRIERLLREESYDAAVCDFLVTAINFPALEQAVLFEHNVETVIWRRHAENATDPLRRAYFRLQERRMFAFEAAACRRAARVVTVSETDAATMQQLFGVNCSPIPTGVDMEYFRPPSGQPERKGLVFVGSMDWMPNVDGVLWFTEHVLPLIRARQPGLPITIVGRTPPPAILALAGSDPFFSVTGTVADVRPYLWNAAVSIVPLRIGGGTRLKIYEAMAAGLPVVSTTVGAEGLDVRDGETIALADSPEEFARRCLDLATDSDASRRMSSAALDLVTSRCSWEHVSRRFEQSLLQAREPAAK